jgi:hypothetical protein
LLDRLTEDARARGISPDLLARDLVEASIQNEQQHETRRLLEELERQVAELRPIPAALARLRRDLALTLETVLLNTTSATKEQEEEFISKNRRT